MSGILAALAGIKTAIATAVDEYFNRVTLLLNTSSTNGAQNNTFLDSSTNNFTITRNGNTTQGTFTPFSQTGWSNFLNTGYLTATSNAAFDFGSGDATIEAWIYPTSSSQTCGIFDKRSSGSNYSQFPQIALSSGAIVVLVSYSGSSWAVTINGATPAVNAWTHIALVRSGNTWTLYVNGSSSGTPVTASGSVYASTDSLSIGAATSGGLNPFTGYISNARLVKGAAVYTTTFTPPTAALTAITNTSLLTCQSNRFVDNSANAFTITPNGTYSVQAFSPFLPTAAYDTAVVGGSGYFDGTGDYLTWTANLNLSNNNFTIEGWFYFTAWGTAAGGNGATLFRHTPNDRFLDLFVEQKKVKLVASGGGVTIDAFLGSTILQLNTWTHIALVRNGTTFTAYINGVAESSPITGVSSSFSNMASVSTGTGDNFITGYVSDLRVVNGTAVYTSGFTPPTAPLTAITNTNSLLKFTNAGIYDSASKNVLETVGNAQVSTTQAKWGSTSMGFTTAGSKLQGNANLGNSVAFGTGDFTVECWVYLTATNVDSCIIDTRAGSNSGNYFLFYLWTSAGTQQPVIAWYVPGGYVLSTGAVSANTWTHLAICRSGTTIRSFKDGVQQQSATNSTSYANPGAPYPNIGDAYGGSTTFQGYIDDLRITRYARYTANFTPPAAAFPIQ